MNRTPYQDQETNVINRRIRSHSTPGSWTHALLVSAALALLMTPAAAGPVGAEVGSRTELSGAREAHERLARQALRRIEGPPLGLPSVPLPADNPPTVAAVRLGRLLFFDPRLSAGGELSCASCHRPEEGFTASEARTAVGNRGQMLRRNSPTLLNVAYAAPFFHDGRQPVLDLQPLEVLVDPDEMAFPSLAAAENRLQSLAEYAALFEEAFAAPPSVRRVGRALGSYLRTLLAANSPFDRWYFAGETEAMSRAGKRGFFLFFGKAGCADCHRITQEAALFTDHEFHDTGVARAGDDLGRYEVTGDLRHRWQFKTPSLRNVALTSPYMHDGSLATLGEVVEFYDQGGFRREGIEPGIEPLGLDEQEKADLVEFLESLTADNIGELAREARGQRSPTSEE